MVGESGLVHPRSSWHGNLHSCDRYLEHSARRVHYHHDPPRQWRLAGMSSAFSKPVNLTTITTGLSGQNGANRWLNYQQDDFRFQDSVCFLYHSSVAAGLHPCPSTIQLLSVIENGHSPGYFPRLVGMISMLSVREDLVRMAAPYPAIGLIRSI